MPISNTLNQDADALHLLNIWRHLCVQHLSPRQISLVYRIVTSACYQCQYEHVGHNVRDLQLVSVLLTERYN